VLNFTIPQGPKGDPGPQGPSGGSTNWRGTWDSGTTYATYDAIAYEGSSYIAVAENTNVTPGTDSSKWQLLAQAGATGATGAKGETGATGSPGAAATIAVGTVTTGVPGSNASVTNAGTNSAAVLNFSIPRGADGAQGDQGPKGDPGTAATIAVGTVTPLAPGSTPTVTNAGTSSAAVLNFGLPTTGTRYWSCQPGLGDGINTIATGTYIQWTCRNDTGSVITLTGISCIADAGSSTVSMTNGTDTALLSAAITCGTSYTDGTQSGTTTLAAGDFIKLTIAASGSKQVAVDVRGTL
jgi:hypothetical protein